MTASVIARDTDSITLEIKIPSSSSSLLESEETIQQALNEVVTLATGEAPA